LAARPFLGLRLLRRIVGGMLRNDAVPGPQAADNSVGIPSAARRLVRDPVCGMHVDETRSIPFRTGASLSTFARLPAATRMPLIQGSLRRTDKQNFDELNFGPNEKKVS